MKTKTKSEIKKEAKSIFKELKIIYDKLDNLMDEAEISAKDCTENEVTKGKAEEFDKYANILKHSRDNAQISYSHLESIH